MNLRQIFASRVEKALLGNIHKHYEGFLNKRNLKINSKQITFSMEQGEMLSVSVGGDWWIPVEEIPELKKIIRDFVTKDYLIFFTSDELSMPISFLFMKLYPAAKPKHTQ